MDRIRYSLVALILSLGLVSAVAQAQTRPYIKAFGADVLAGGWFNNGTAFCNQPPSVDNYQDPIQTGDSHAGGIIAYTKTETSPPNPPPNGRPTGGSSGQFGVLALGIIEGTFGSGNGFNSNGASSGGNGSDYTSFANDVSGLDFGGEFQGSINQGHCIPDYFVTKGSATALNALPDISTAQGKFIQTAPGPSPIVVNNTADTILPGNVLTLFVDGDAYIGANIEYSSGSNVTHVPKFALVVRGSIFIDGLVSRLD